MESPRSLLREHDPAADRNLSDYLPFVDRKRLEALRLLAEPLRGRTWLNVNSTFVGGGVAELLASVIPLARSLGIDARWYAIQGHAEFFNVTKKFHNLLQGVRQDITLEEIFGTYLDTIADNARGTSIEGDFVVIHDAQPAGLLANGVISGNVLWRCHVDTTTPDPVVWRFLLPYVNRCSGAIFSMPEYVAPGLTTPVYQVLPCIDPLTPKNRHRTADEAAESLAPLFAEHDVDPAQPIVAAISRYDIHKNQETILRAFQLFRDRSSHDPRPILIFLGNSATDDPEGGAMLERLREAAGDDPDVRFWVNVDRNDEVVGSLMRLARLFVHASTREGFGLVVSEALWQGTPVIGSKVGGIATQIVDGEGGFLIKPLDVEALAGKITRLLDRPDEARAMGERGRERVRSRFLLPELLRRYLLLMRYHCGIDSASPKFRLNDIATSEAQLRARRVPPGPRPRQPDSHTD